MFWTEEELKELKNANFYSNNMTFMEVSREVSAPNMVYDFVLKSRLFYTAVVHYKKHDETGISWVADKLEFPTFEELISYLHSTVNNHE